MLEIINLRKSYGTKTVLQGVTLSVARGQVMSLLGANGAGKTTLASIVAGLRTADSGEVRVGGLDAISRTRFIRRLIGLAPQELGIYPTLSVVENLRFFGRLCGLFGQKLDKRIQEVAEALSLEEILLQTAGTLSGGQKRRLHTGTALLHCPPLVFLDEPTVGADVRTRAEILRLVHSLAAQGSAVVYSTHYLQEVESLGASVCILESGRILT